MRTITDDRPELKCPGCGHFSKQYRVRAGRRLRWKCIKCKREFTSYEPIACAYCQKEFHPNGRNKKYCSVLCQCNGKRCLILLRLEKNRKVARLAKDRVLNCPECGDPFHSHLGGRSKGRKYCSASCYQSASSRAIRIRAARQKRIASEILLGDRYSGRPDFGYSIAGVGI